MLRTSRRRAWACLAFLAIPWGSRPVIAEDQTAASEVVIGGIVRGEQGEPIENVRLKFWGGRDSGGYNLEAKTGPDGRWQGRAPSNLRADQLLLYHTDYVCVPVTRSVPPEDRLRVQNAVITMKRGRLVHGKVRDSLGNPVANALVLTQPYNVDMDKPDDDLTTARTREDGTFAVRNMPGGRQWLAIYDERYAPQVVMVEVSDRTPPVDIELSPPGEVNGQIVDGDGHPVSGVTVSAGAWNVGPKFPLRQSETSSDNEGRFRLGGLPRQGTLELSYAKEGFLQTLLSGVQARREPYTLRIPRPTTFRGQVLDDRTGEPIKTLTVVKGRRWSHSDDMVFSHRRAEEVQADDGRFVTSFDGSLALPPFPKVAVRVMAKGYLPAEIGPLSVGDQSDMVTLRLQPSEPILGMVVDPQGQPARDAQVAWVGPKRIAFIQHGRFMTQFTYGPELFAETDAEGRFELPASRDDGLIVVLHESGYAERRLSKHDEHSAIQLTAWSRIEGRVSAGNDPIGEVNVSLTPLDPRLAARDEISWYLYQRTHVDGTFTIDFVPSTPFSIAYNRALLSSHKTRVAPQAGETVYVNVGGTGGAVAGRLKKPNGLNIESFSDEFEVGIHCTQVVAYPAEDASRKREDRDNYVAQLKPDGSFVIHDLAPRAYRLEVNVHAPVPPESCGLPVNVAEARGEFQISSKPSDVPLELGAIELDLATGPQPGQQAPPLVGKTLSGDSFDLAKLRGKLVLLDFWATWCGPCKAATPALKQLYETYGRDGRITFVGIDLDYAAETAANYVEQEGIAWPQLPTGSWGEENAVLREFAVTSAPSFWIISADGTVVARDIPIGELAGRIAAAIRNLDPEGTSGKEP